MTQTGVIWKMEIATEKVPPPDFLLGKPVMHFFFFFGLVIDEESSTSLCIVQALGPICGPGWFKKAG